MSNRYSSGLAQLSRRKKTLLQLLVDFCLICVAYGAAMFARLESTAFLAEPRLVAVVVLPAIIALMTFYRLGLYRVLVRFASGDVLVIIAKGAGVAAVALFTVSALFETFLPRSVPMIYAVFIFLGVGGTRFLARNFFRSPNDSGRAPVIIYGAGEAGIQLLSLLALGQQYTPVALVDDDPALHNMAIGGVRVHGPDDLPRLIRETGAQSILLAMPSIGRARRREVIAALEALQVEIKTIPGMSDIISGKAKISELRTVTPEDLLGRDAVTPDATLLQKNIRSRVVMVTGAGGSIGSELCRQICQQEPRRLVLFDVSEPALYAIDAELAAQNTGRTVPVDIVPVLGSVLNRMQLEDVISSFGVETIYHAAAYKHVPLLEDNAAEAVRNNIFGTFTLASVARAKGVANFILISTDKAVRPANVMGATKRMAELICQAFAKEGSDTVFSMVRFGNVLGSSGSVIPRFQAQIEAGGPVTVTHREINRFFMTIPEASQLVIQAGAMSRGGDVFVLDMGQPVKILDLAMSMVRLHGLKPYLVEDPDAAVPDDGDIPIYISGLRKGEKIYEELLIGNDPLPTQHPRISTASEISMDLKAVEEALRKLEEACAAHDAMAVRNILQELPLGYSPAQI